MNYRRLALASIAATVVDIAYGVFVYGGVLSREISMYGGIFRRVDEVNANMPWMVLGVLVATTAATSLFASGGENRTGVRSGLQFGVSIGLLVVGYGVIGNYVVMRIGKRLAVYFAMAGLLEWTIIGAVIGFVYRPNRVTPER